MGLNKSWQANGLRLLAFSLTLISEKWPLYNSCYACAALDVWSIRNIYALVAQKLFVLFIGHIVACSTRIVLPDRQTDRQTNTHS